MLLFHRLHHDIHPSSVHPNALFHYHTTSIHGFFLKGKNLCSTKFTKRSWHQAARLPARFSGGSKGWRKSCGRCQGFGLEKSWRFLFLEKKVKETQHRLEIWKLLCPQNSNFGSNHGSWHNRGFQSCVAQPLRTEIEKSSYFFQTCSISRGAMLLDFVYQQKSNSHSIPSTNFFRLIGTATCYLKFDQLDTGEKC